MTNATIENTITAAGRERIALELIDLARAAEERMPTAFTMPGLDETEAKVRLYRGRIGFLRVNIKYQGRRFAEVAFEEVGGRRKATITCWGSRGDTAAAALQAEALAVAADMAREVEELR
jgi:hypothetical protein